VTLRPERADDEVQPAAGADGAGLGIAIIAQSALGEAAESVGLRVRAIEHPMLMRHIGLIESATRSLSPAAQQFAGVVYDACRGMR